jgi:glycerol-3-phosphate acyltransferase PlsY
MNYVVIVGLALSSYLLGAVPFGFLIARARGVDIRRVGSGNIGATNVFRSVGKTWGILAFVCDALKGFVPAFWFASLGELPQSAVLQLLFGCAAIAGHNWPVYLGFRGGKGVATSAGALVGIAPLSMGIGLAAWLISFLVTRYVSFASIAAALVVGGSAWLPSMPYGLPVRSALSGLALLTIWRHKSNIRRLLDGTEHRFGSGKKRTGSSQTGTSTPGGA